VLARGFVERIVRPRRDEEPWVALLSGERRRRGVWAHVRNPGIEGLRHRGQQDVREDDAGEDVDFVQANVLLGQLLADLGLELVVADFHLHRQPAELAAIEL